MKNDSSLLGHPILKDSLALIGHPITLSKSYQYHNYFLAHLGLIERYGKFDIQSEQLKEFLFQAKHSSMRGLSVTMPLKEQIIPLLDEVDEEAQQIGAVNTVKFVDGKAKGYNTDNWGALQAIKHCYSDPLAGKKVIIVGAGGAAKAIAWGLAKAGMQITIANRTMEKATALANLLQAKTCSLDNLPSLLATECDFLIQATSMGMLDQSVVINPKDIHQRIVVFDVISAPQNGWLDKLAKQGCLTISGRLFWVFQAIEQYKIWFDNQLDLSAAFSILQKGLEITE